MERSISSSGNQAAEDKELVKKVTIDSSVIVSSLVLSEARHREAREIWESVLDGRYFAIMPFTVLPEVVSAIRRRTGSPKIALEVQQQILDTRNLALVEVEQRVAVDAAKIAAKTGARGMDALVIQVAIEYDAELITFDKEMAEAAAEVL